MKISQSIAVTDESQVGAARRAANLIAREQGMDETDAGKVAIVVSEAARNQLKYAGGGQIFLRALGEAVHEDAGVEILAVDNGPGMGDVAHSLRDGYSTGGTSGNGLGAIQRLSATFDIFTAPDCGTVILSRCIKNQGNNSPGALPSTSGRRRAASGPLWREQARGEPMQWGLINIPIFGEHVCGDSWAVGRRTNKDIFMICDGLGHGPLAAEASGAAREAVFHLLNDETGYYGPVQILEKAHRAMLATRGGAMAVVEVDRENSTAQFAGVGNIGVSIFNGLVEKKLPSPGGIVGGTMRKPVALSAPFPPNATLIMYSDGITSHWSPQRYPGLLNRHPAVVAAVIFRDFQRGRDDATVLVASEY